MDRKSGTYRVVIGGRLAEAKARRPLYALLNGSTSSRNRTGPVPGILRGG